ncbi:MAG: hypothetical protein LWY06_12925 [Firmicutes bacterium]|nr:hypothetical protein [Bacillota bacterium]
MTDSEQTPEIQTGNTEQQQPDTVTNENKFFRVTGIGLFIQILTFALSYAYIWMYPRWSKTGLGWYTNEMLPAAFAVLAGITAILFFLIIVLPIIRKNLYSPGLIMGAFTAGSAGLVFLVFIFYFAFTTYDITGSMNLLTPNPFPFLKLLRFILFPGVF